MRRLADRLLAAGEALSVLVLALMVLHLLATIAARSLLGISPTGTTEMVADLYMPLLVFAALARSYRLGEEIRVDLIAGHLPPRLARWQDRACQLLVALCSAALAWFTGKLALHAFAIGDRIEFGQLALPGWPAKAMVALGFALLALAALQRMLPQPEAAA